MLTRRAFVGFAGTALVGAAGIVLTGCGGARGGQEPDASKPAGNEQQAEAPASKPADKPAEPAKKDAAAASAASALVVYFSHAGENYGVGVVEEGNTAVIAKMIAEKTSADLFEIVPKKDYPQGYDECCDVALDEQHESARPAYKDDVDIAPYDTIYLGYPIWWGDLPMCVYTFVEARGWQGKKVRPFCTHAGSGLSGTVEALEAACKGATVGEGFSLEGTTAQNSRDEARASVEKWIG